MKGVALTLPGGLDRGGVVYRDAVLEPVTGHLERAISEELDAAENLPKGISNVLAVALHSIGGVEVDMDTVFSLCVADRQYIMMCLANRIDGNAQWISSQCTHCSEFFDVSLQRSELPVRKAGDSYPWVKLDCCDHKLVLRVPNGDDQSSIAGMTDEMAILALLKACLVKVEPEVAIDNFVNKLSDKDIERIDAALEKTAPATCTSIATKCPECNAEQTLYIDPYGINVLEAEALYAQIHTLAYYYHWSESDILALPRSRRYRYLNYIDASHGIYS